MHLYLDVAGLSYLDAYLCDKVTCEAPIYKYAYYLCVLCLTCLRIE